MGDCLQAGTSSRYVTSHQVNSAFHPSGVGKPSTSLSRWGYRQSAFTCVGWQVTLYDPIWQVTSRSSGVCTQKQGRSSYGGITHVASLKFQGVGEKKPVKYLNCTEFGQLIFKKIIKIVATHLMSYFNSISAGALPQTPLGSSQRSPKPHSLIKGSYF